MHRGLLLHGLLLCWLLSLTPLASHRSIGQCVTAADFTADQQIAQRPAARDVARPQPRGNHFRPRLLALR